MIDTELLIEWDITGWQEEEITAMKKV